MQSVGIITIHRIYNYGSILQAYALCRVVREMGYDAEVIDYVYPNEFQKTYIVDNVDKAKKKSIGSKQKILKYCYALELLGQHKKMRYAIKDLIPLSTQKYYSIEDLMNISDKYDIYLTGSDQVWNPIYTKGDPAFLLKFVAESKKKISYAASFGISEIDKKYRRLYSDLLQRYNHVSVREKNGERLVSELTENRMCAKTVLDPTLLLDRVQWNSLLSPKRLIKKQYILCYFLNYTFNAFPYADQLIEYFQKCTGYEVVRLGRPPVKLFNHRQRFYVDAGPLEMLQLVRDAELVLTTSFHGTAFAVNFGIPVYSVVESVYANDSRQINLLGQVGLNNRVISIGDPFPSMDNLQYDISYSQYSLCELRKQSLEFLKQSLND